MMKPGQRGTYQGTDKEGRLWTLPRHVDPELDGISLAEKHPVIFKTDSQDDSIPIEEFDLIIEKAVPQQVIARIEQVIQAGIFLHSRGLADKPPVDLRAWRRGMIVSWSHARDLAVVHDALGHPLQAVGHDMDEVVLAKHLKNRLVPEASDWYKDYVNSLDEGAWVNVGFFNPHISASLFKWGDAKGGIQNAMDAHRLAAHHQGTPENPLDWIERAVNFVVHHIPREHWGIRHEPRGNWKDLELRMSEDPAIKDAEIGKVIARDAAKLFELLERKGKVVPWQLLKLPDYIAPSELEHAQLVIKASEKIAQTNSSELEITDEDESANPFRVERAKKVLKQVNDYIRSSNPNPGLTEMYKNCLLSND